MMRYCPDPSVTTVRTFSISAGLAASTVTPGKNAPDASLAAPAIVPSTCAYVDAEIASNAAQKITDRNSRVIGCTPFMNVALREAEGSCGADRRALGERAGRKTPAIRSRTEPGT